MKTDRTNVNINNTVYELMWGFNIEIFLKKDSLHNSFLKMMEGIVFFDLHYLFVVKVRNVSHCV